MIEQLRRAYRSARVSAKVVAGIEPHVTLDRRMPLEFHGNDYCGWAIPAGSINRDSVIADVGVGEDISFSTSLISRFGCAVHGFDPTPRAKVHVEAVNEPRFTLHDLGLADETRDALFHLPSDPSHVSGSLLDAGHVKGKSLRVLLIDTSEMFRVLKSDRIDLLKIDIEGSEYDVIGSKSFATHAASIDTICLEFHHRWPEIGRQRTVDAVATLKSHGFECVWRSKTTNEEFTFVRVQA